MATKKDKKKKSAAKPVKKSAKPAAKKAGKAAAKNTKPAKKAAKPARAQKAAKPAKAKKAEVKAPKKEVKKALSKAEEAKLKKKGATAVKVDPKSAKAGKESKKGKPAQDELEEEGLDVEGGLLEMEPVENAEEEDDLIEEMDVDDKPKKRGRGRAPKKEGKKHYDSEDFVRKQVVRIDLSKPLIKKPKKIEPEPYVNNKDKRSRYSDKELAEFKEIILQKLDEAKVDYELLKQTLTNADNHGTDDTSPTFKLLEDGSDMLSKEEIAQLASRQEKYIVNLQNALIRIQNKTYGICRVTGKLIPKERLRSVPHATLSIDAKLSQYN
jgi:RNA polymerase-binding transcription factor DksA